MKIHISADIEGVRGITHWDEANKGKKDLVLWQHLLDGLYRGHPCPLNSSGQGCPGDASPVNFTLPEH